MVGNQTNSKYQLAQLKTCFYFYCFMFLIILLNYKNKRLLTLIILLIITNCFFSQEIKYQVKHDFQAITHIRDKTS